MSVLELQTGGIVIMSDDDIRNQTFITGQLDDVDNNEKITGKLKEPRDLYSTASLQHIPKWPIEMEVIPEKIRHIDVPCHKLETFYTPNSAEIQPKPVGEEMGTVIYNYQPKLSVDYFCRSCAGGSESLTPVFEQLDVNTLKFESRFESGNLAKVIKVTNVYYELYLRPDMYTDRHSQWFYFRIQNTKENVTYRFSIVNLNKPDSLYRYGLKPLIYSEKEAQLNNLGWMRCGQNISYYKNDVMADENNSFYSLTFNLRFRHSNDTVYLAQCYPYTYTKLQNYLTAIEANEVKSKLCQQRLLCRSLAGNNIYVLTITSPDNYLEENLKKPAVVISARVHPGETQSSYMMKGIIDFLTSNASQAKDLRDRFIFKLIPMLNPDGVIVGNSRCCLLGQDLNRQYRTVLREAFPQIYHTKQLVRRLSEENGIFLYCDLHGHSRRNNVFMYGCENKRIPEKKLIEQVFPLMMHKNASDKFSFQNCKFKIQRSKEGTGRVFAWTLGVDLSYTLEISLGGSTLPSRQHTHFNTYDYEAIGRHFCETLLDYSDTAPAKERMKERILQKLLEAGSNADEPLNIPITDYSSESEESGDGDGDEDEEGELEKKSSIKNNNIRRQNSIKSSKKIKPRPATTLKIERSVINLSKATVEYVRTGQKYRRLDENPESMLQKSIAMEKEKEKEQDCMTRLSKFRRRSRRVSFSIVNEKQSTNNNSSSNILSTKCTSILFDDPFKPPDVTTTALTTIKSFQFGCDDLSLRGDEVMEVTEDECDDCDGAFKNQKYLLNEEIPSLDISDELALLQLSPKLDNIDSRTVSPATTMTTSTMAMSSSLTLVKPRLKPMPTPTHDQSVYTKSERRTRATLQKQEAIRRDSIGAKLNTLNEQSLKRHSFSSLSSPTAVVVAATTATRHSLSASKERLDPSSPANLTSLSAGTKSVFTLAQSQTLSRRRVSWTGISASPLYNNGSNHGSGGLSGARNHRGSIGLIPLTTTTSHSGNSSSGNKKDSQPTKGPKTLKKSKSMGDKIDDMTTTTTATTGHHHHHHHHHNSNRSGGVHGHVGGTGSSSTKKKKTKSKKTKSRK